MTELLPQCSNLAGNVNSIIELFKGESSLRNQQDTSKIEIALQKAISPKFEIVFAGAFSAGKSMLINALLERELLYSAEGHATGTECYIEYAEADEERVVLTFLSEVEIRTLVDTVCQNLQLTNPSNINSPEYCRAQLELRGKRYNRDTELEVRPWTGTLTVCLNYRT